MLKIGKEILVLRRHYDGIMWSKDNSLTQATATAKIPQGQ